MSARDEHSQSLRLLADKNYGRSKFLATKQLPDKALRQTF